MKVLHVGGLLKGIRNTKDRLYRLEDQVKQLQERVKAVVMLDDSFRGKGAQAIRSFYEELHLPFLLFLERFIVDYRDVLHRMESRLLDLEPDEDGYIHQQFLEGDLVDGLKKAEQVTIHLTDETNALLKSVKDIVSLPYVDDEEFLFTLTQGRSQIYEAVEKLHAYDTDQTAMMENIENDVQVMKQYVAKINEKHVSGDLRVAGYSAKQLAGVDAYDQLLKGIQGMNQNYEFSSETAAPSDSSGPLPRIAPVQGATVRYVQRKWEKRTVGYGFRMMRSL
ncbi:LXG domain-containing protein [Lentibacillus sp. N15]|uniref:ribonuclease YeeF family protein n=1 Tax=Lentibacillus songyuanensis TaxID=3136161 RepID=UPI0031BB073E